jgi:hypothetical protein
MKIRIKAVSLKVAIVGLALAALAVPVHAGKILANGVSPSNGLSTSTGPSPSRGLCPSNGLCTAES